MKNSYAWEKEYFPHAGVAQPGPSEASPQRAKLFGIPKKLCFFENEQVQSTQRACRARKSRQSAKAFKLVGNCARLESNAACERSDVRKAKLSDSLSKLCRSQSEHTNLVNRVHQKLRSNFRHELAARRSKASPAQANSRSSPCARDRSLRVIGKRVSSRTCRFKSCRRRYNGFEPRFTHENRLMRVVEVIQLQHHPQLSPRLAGSPKAFSLSKQSCRRRL